MIFDRDRHTGKLAALRPSFELMAELTGKESSPNAAWLYVETFVDLNLAMDDVNTAVAEILKGWQKPYWPSAEAIAARAQEIARRSGSSERWRSFQQEIDEVFARADAERWEHRLEIANGWRTQNAERFKVVVRGVDRMITQLTTMFGLKPELNARLVKSQEYRKAFRDGAVVSGCIEQSGIDDRKAAKMAEKGRGARAKEYAVTGHIPDHAA